MSEGNFWGDLGSSIWNWAKSPEGISTIGTGIGALAGGVAAKKGQTPMQKVLTSTGGSSSTSRTGAPDYVLPYLTGDKGVYGLAQQTYNRNIDQGYQGMSPQQIAMNNNMVQALSRYGSGDLAQRDQMARTFGQRYNTDPSGVNAPQAWHSMGAANPLDALSSMLRGDIDTRGLDAMQAAAGDRAGMQYQQMIDQFNEQTNPAIRSNALMAGQYGSSRHGIAEGLARKGMMQGADNLARENMNIGADLYGNAYNQANQQRYGAASNLGAQGLQNAQFNKTFGMGANLQNAGLEQQGMSMRDQALQSYLGAMGAQYDILGRPAQNAQNAQQFQWDQLNQYLNAVHGATPGSTTQSGSSSKGYTIVPATGTPIMEGAAQGGAIGQGLADILNTARQ